MADTEFTDETIRHRFFRDLVESERVKVFKAFGVYPEDCTERLDHSIERRLLNLILRRPALASRPAEVDDEGLPPAPTAIPRASNDALNAMATYWKLDGDWMTCKGCRRSLIASRDGEELAHGDGCKYWDQQHPWAQLRELIARRPAPAGVAQ